MRHKGESKHDEPMRRVANSSEKPLQSWKEIAAYLERDERTARRWEKTAGLPVRRHHGGPRSTVYAYPSEFEAWRAAHEPKASQTQLWQWGVPVATGALTIVLGAWFILYGPVFNPPNPMVEAADGIVVREIWSGRDANHFGGPSPDGKYLSFVDWKTGDLAIREVETGETRRLTNEGIMRPPLPPKAYALYSTISPDGAKVAYSWCQGGKCDLRLIGLDGSGSRTLLSPENQDVFPASWSSDGRFIAALVYGKGMDGIVLVSAADGAVRVLKENGSLPFTYLAFSPSDQFLAFDFRVQGQEKDHDISLLATDGSGELSLIQHPANDRLLGWIPNRNEILFLSDRMGTEDIWAVKVAQGKIQGSPQPLKREVGEIVARGFTQDGHLYFYYYTRWFTLQTARFNLAKGELQGRPATLLGSNFGPDWSPDGKHLAYVAEHRRRGGDFRLHVRDQNTGEERELASDLDVIKTPRWSPDGLHILFRGTDRNTRTAGFYQVNVKTGVVTSLVEGLSKKWWASIAEWSVDGEAIYYVDSGRLVLRDLASGQEKELYSEPHLTRLLDLSPDGKWLVFVTDQSESVSGSLLIMPSLGGAVRELFKKPEEKRTIGDAVWTPDSKYILFALDDYQLKGTEVWRITPEGENPEKLWRTENQIAGLSIHPSGQEIAFSIYTEESGVWAMEEYLAAIR